MTLPFEVAPHYDGRPQPGWRWPGRRRAGLYLLLAVLLTAGLLLVPLGTTLVISLKGARANYGALLGQGDVGQAVLATVIWLAFAPIVCALGAGLAWLVRAAPRPLRMVVRVALVLPAVVSPLTTGVIFRLIFDAHAERGTVNGLLGLDVAFLGPGWVWLVLFLAFAWQWTGVAFLLFQGGLARVPRDLLRMARAYGVGRAGRFWSIVVPAMAPLATLAYLIVLIAAARVFDLVLAGAPGSMLGDVGGLGLFWWLHNVDLGDGAAAALAILLSVLVAVFALPTLFGLRRGWHPTDPAPYVPAPRRRRVAVVLSTLVAALWLVPFVVLVATSLREPLAAATSAWWSGGFVSFSSYGEAFSDNGFTGALVVTFLRTLLVTLVVLAVAMPAAYVLAHERLRSRKGMRFALGLALALAALPPQAFAVPLQDTLSSWVGFFAALVAVYAAVVLPLAVVVLYNGFVRVRSPMVAHGRWGLPGMAWQALPTVILAGVLAFVLVWNDMVIGLVLNWPAGDHVSLALLEQARHFTTSAGTLAAGGVVATAVPMLLVVLTMRWLWQGLIEGVRR